MDDVLRSGGEPLDATTRSSMEKLFRHDFGDVRVHTDSKAVRSADALDAAAYAVGSDVVFGAGRYRPRTPDGRRLVAHELSHVVQQRHAAYAEPGLRASEGPAEREAETAAAPVGFGRPAGPLTRQATARVQRQPRNEAPALAVESRTELEAALGLPPGTVPPGAERNPAFVESLFAPGSAMRLEEVRGVPESIAESMPEGELVEMPELTKTLMAGEAAHRAAETVGKRGGEVGEALEHSRYVKYGGTVFKAVSWGYSIYRIAKAPAEERPEVVGEEGGRLGGGYVGGRAGTGVCLAAAPETGGVSLLVCGLVGSYAFEKVGEKLGGWIGRTVENIIELPEHLAEASRRLGELIGSLSTVVEGMRGAMPPAVIGGGIMSRHYRLAVDNWDLRGVPPGLRPDLRAVGTQVWGALSGLSPDALLAQMEKPIAAFGVPVDAVTRIAAGSGGGAAAYTPGALLAMRPLEFVAAMRGIGLDFVQDPDYVAGFGGRWSEPDFRLEFDLEPLVRDRATSNPANWDLSRLPAVTLADGRRIDLRAAIESGGETVWRTIAGLREPALKGALGMTMRDLGLGRDAAADIADGVNRITDGFVTLDADALLGADPPAFVALLQGQLGATFAFVKDPDEIARLSLEWVKAGFQPW